MKVNPVGDIGSRFMMETSQYLTAVPSAKGIIKKIDGPGRVLVVCERKF
jgi:hypothetical protein